MKFKLTDYQVLATSQVVDAIHEAFQRHIRSGKQAAIALCAPTGAGKTVIATDVIEKLLFGDGTREGNSRTTFLWVTDDPSLNAQTRRKMLLASSKLRASRLVSVDPSLDQQILDAGKIYFVHIQQLGKGATKYVQAGNSRQYTLWETIGATIAEKGSEFVLIVDEAHRGTSARPGGSKTIVSQLMDGAGGQFPPVPVVLGISATPQRFSESMSRAGNRVFEPVTVDPNEVRKSGLLKDKVLIRHPKGEGPGDYTLLRQAVDDLRNYDAEWSKYSEEQSEPRVVPCLVVQVRPKISPRDLEEILETMAAVWPVLKGKAVGHAFQEHAPIHIGDRVIRYVAPQDIQDDQSLRVVLFKEALTTGWDCPRAEVMISLRSGSDYTYIAQLIGRMVRTPLARRVDTSDVLNSVSLYLPHFDQQQVDAVVAGLRSGDTQITSDIDVNSSIFGRNGKVPAHVWEVIAQLPTYTRPARCHRSEVARLNSLAMLLTGTQLNENAVTQARLHLVKTIDREVARLGAALEVSVTTLRELDFRTIEVDLLRGSSEISESKVALDGKNADDLFRRAKRVWGDGAALWYWNELCDRGLDSDDAKLTVAALASDEGVGIAIESGARDLIDTWRNSYNGAITLLKDAKRSAFYEIWQESRAAARVNLIMPSHIISPLGGHQYSKHVYAKGGQFPAELTTWEIAPLERELARSSLVAWYRNPSAGTRALAVPYEQSARQQTMYPDLLFFHRSREGGLHVDIVDPHRPDKSDAGPKWLGLSLYAQEHANYFRRVLAVIMNEDGKLQSLDLKNSDVSAALQRSKTELDIRRIFSQFGGLY